MKLRNKKTGEICELGHIRQAWREEKDGGMGYMLLKADDNNGIIYNSLAEMMEEWEDYIPKEPLIKNEEIREIVRAWAEANGLTEKIMVINEHFDCCKIIGRCDSHNICLEIEFKTTIAHVNKNQFYTIAELCGEEEE